MNLHSAGAKTREHALRADSHCLEANDVARASGRVDLTCRDHRRYPAIEARIDPAELVLPRRPVACHRMDVAVDEPGRHRHAIGIDDARSTPRIHILFTPDFRDPPPDRHDRVGIEDRILERTREQQADVSDDQLLPFLRFSCFLLRHPASPPRLYAMSGKMSVRPELLSTGAWPSLGKSCDRCPQSPAVSKICAFWLSGASPACSMITPTAAPGPRAPIGPMKRI